MQVHWAKKRHCPECGEATKQCAECQRWFCTRCINDACPACNTDIEFALARPSLLDKIVREI